MKRFENRREFFQKLGVISLATSAASLIPMDSLGHSMAMSPLYNIPALKSLSPSSLFSVLDLSNPELADVRKALEQKGHDAALNALLSYYRNRFPKTTGLLTHLGADGETKVIQKADNLEKHIFQWGPYPAAAYGTDIDWAADPAEDIEWVAGINRFYWINDLANAYQLTGDERYVQTFIELINDWIRKHPLENTMNLVHPVYGWKGYPWLSIQTGIRATNICSNFSVLVHAMSFTPRFLGVLLASLYDHQVKTEKMPMGKIHNMVIFEQRGFFDVLNTFPEFKDTEKWLGIAMNITCENLLVQTTIDGVQREWCGVYHLEVYSDAIHIDNCVNNLGRKMPDHYKNRIKAMGNHIFGMATPDLSFPMFGDTSRKMIQSKDRRTWKLYEVLKEASQRFDDPKFQALADLDLPNLPKNGSIAFPGAGFYAMRNGWTPDQIYLALHCSPPSINPWHDQPDNGTFELYAYGRWLMPDTGFYTYGHDKEDRNWHRQTRVHPTLTLNGKDTDIFGRQLFWQSDENMDIVCVENQSYPLFLHRRTIWFSGKNKEIPFFVIFDEAICDAKGDLELHFPLAPGPVTIDHKAQSITTGFEDVNLLIQIKGKNPFSLSEEEGWTATVYGKREQRTSVTSVYEGAAPAAFVSILVPYRGKIAPECFLLTDPDTFIAGKDPVEIQVELSGEKYILHRKIKY